MTRKPKPLPLVHMPWECPYEPPQEMMVEDRGDKTAYEVAARFCIVEHRCRLSCARKRPCMESHWTRPKDSL